MKLSIVTTLYKSESHIVEFHKRASLEAKKFANTDYEIIYVNDGSPLNDLEVAKVIFKQDRNVKIIDLSANFGHHKAMIVGLSKAQGDLIYLIDSDLEEKPEWLTIFNNVLLENGADVVYGVNGKRNNNWLINWFSNFYYYIFTWLIDIEHPKNIVTARLMKKEYVDSLLLFKEREIFISCLWAMTGYRQIGINVEKTYKGVTSYNFLKRMNLAIDCITSFSRKPLIIIFYTGILIFSISIIYCAKLLIDKFIFNRFIDGWTSIVVSIWLLGGLMILFMGLVALYISKIYIEVKSRPIAIIKKTYERAISNSI